MLYLREDTASQSVLIGPFIDETDGISALTGLTINASDIRLSANGGNIAAKNSGGGTHDELGYYTITLDATDTATVGRLQLMVHATGALPVYHEFQVMEEAAFDAIFAASAAPATAAGVSAVETDTQDIQSRLPAALVSGRIDASVGAMAANTLTASALAADAVTEIQSGLATSAALATVDGNVDSILVDTGTTLPGLIGTPSVDLATDIAAVSTAIAALNDISAAEVNAEVVDALATDTYAEPTGVPPATDTLAGKISRLHMALRNRVDVTATKKTFYDDGGAAEWEQDLSDDGTTYSQSEANAI